jgi:hypothetical protein
MSEPAGLVLGHSVWVSKVGGQAHRGKVTSLNPDVTIWLDRAKWSDAFREGDRVRALHTGRQAVEATVAEAAAGRLVLKLLLRSCERCGAPLIGWGVSYFNTDTCCAACLDDERKAPGYEAARAAESAAVRAGDLNFRGVGLSPADAAFLADRRAAR